MVNPCRNTHHGHPSIHPKRLQHLFWIRLGAVFTHQKEDFRKDLILRKVRYKRYIIHIITIWYIIFTYTDKNTKCLSLILAKKIVVPGSQSQRSPGKWTGAIISALRGWQSLTWGCPERLWNLLLWGYSKPAWMPTCMTYSRELSSVGRLDLMISKGSFQPLQFCKNQDTSPLHLH